MELQSLFLLCVAIFSVHSLDRGFTRDFQQYLDQNYKIFGFERSDIRNGAHGGAEVRPTKQPQRVPIVFIHGNSDIGVGDGSEGIFFTGWSEQIEYYLSYGYTKADLYVTTWGDGLSVTSSLKYHSENYLKYLRTFLLAVLDYTKSPYVNVIGHSMGVTLGRKIIKGGYANDELGSGTYYLGDPLTDRIKVFVGLAGANEGLTSCYTTSTTLPTCGSTNGFFPGQPPFITKSNFLKELDDNRAREASWVVSFRAPYDEIIGQDCLVWGKYTTRIKREDEEIVINSPVVGHFGLRDTTAPYILQIFQQRNALYQ